MTFHRFTDTERAAHASVARQNHRGYHASLIVHDEAPTAPRSPSQQYEHRVVQLNMRTSILGKPRDAGKLQRLLDAGWEIVATEPPRLLGATSAYTLRRARSR